MNITVIKQDPAGRETWRYTGAVLKRAKNHIILEAFFDRDDMELNGIWLCRGDRFVETYFFNRWYNIFEIHDQSDDRLKGWYCNISSPATETDGLLVYRDFALDLLVFPDGRQIVLDQDEFAALELHTADRQKAEDALTELQNCFSEIV